VVPHTNICTCSIIDNLKKFIFSKINFLIRKIKMDAHNRMDMEYIIIKDRANISTSLL